MKYKHRSLWGDDYSCQAFVEAKLKPHYSRLCEVIMAPWQRLRDRIKKNDSEFVHLTGIGTANWMHSQIIEVGGRVFKGVPNVRVRPERFGTTQMFAVVIDEEVCVGVKKLREENLVRSNTPTEHNTRYWGRNRALFDDNLRVLFGYQPVRADTELKLWLTYPISRKENAWMIGIDHAAFAATVAAPVQPKTRKPQKGFDVSIQRKDAKDGVEGSGAEGNAG